MVGFLFLEWLYCMHSKRLTYGSNRVFDFLVLWILPVGLLLLLSALFFVGNRNVLHRIVYILFSVPTLFLLCMRPREFKDLLREPLAIAFLAFSAWALTSLLWSPAPSSPTRQAVSTLQVPDSPIFWMILKSLLLLVSRCESSGACSLTALRGTRAGK